MNQKAILRACLLCALVVGGRAASVLPDGQLPNIVLILADDLGYGDAGCYNPESRVPTPNIDRLAREGMRFTSAYSPDALCTPSRYSMMTGRYSWRTKHRRSVQLNWEKPLIEEGRMTVPWLLKAAGYTTAGLGKWHLGADFPTTDGLIPVGQGGLRHELDGANIDLSQPLRGGPKDRGFDRWFGFICAGESIVYDDYFATAYIDVHPRPVARNVEELRHIPLATYLPELTERATAFIDTHAAAAKKGTPFFLWFSPYVPHIPLAIAEGFKGRTKGGDYGDYVHQLDYEIGRILAALERQGLSENTLVVFTSDNGSHFETTGEGHRPNGPLSGTKATLREGGVRVPLVARWPERIPAGKVSDKIVASTDLLATVAALVRKPLPPQAGEDSFNVLPILLGDPQARSEREFLIMRSKTAQLAIRQGRWKYVAPVDFPWVRRPEAEAAEAQLFDLEADPTEVRNVIGAQGEVAAALRRKLLLAVESPGTVAGLLKQ